MVDTVREMKDSYARLVAGVSESQSRESLSPGHLLFLAFDSLFNNYERSVRGVHIGTASVPGHCITSFDMILKMVGVWGFPKMSIELHPRTGGLSCRESSSSNCKVYLSRATWGSESKGARFMFSEAFQKLQSVEAGGGSFDNILDELL